MMRALAVLLLLATPVAAQEHPTGYDPYEDWEQPGGWGSCCHKKDCRPSRYCPLPSGDRGLMLDGACIPIPYDLVVPYPSPDGMPHICATNDGTPLCAVLPETA
jgi:hypothetical protein